MAVFVGAFRSWHGAVELVDAVRQLRERGRSDIKAVLIGEGPELVRAREAAVGLDGVVLTGALPHERIPACLAAADIGVAPFNLSAHPNLVRDFHWSPLKIFEYMSSGLPVVAPRVERLAGVVRHEQEGLLYEPGNPLALAAALERLTDVDFRVRLGRAARARAVAHFSWRSHCEALDRAIRSACDAHSDRH